MATLKAVLWDVDGTLAESERDGHRVAFNLAFAAAGLPWLWSEAHYGDLLCITGGRERLLHDMTRRSDAPTLADERMALVRTLHESKNRHFAALVQGGGLPLRPGVHELMDECSAQGVHMGIVTTTSRVNVQVLLQRHLGPRWHERFAVLVCGEDVGRKKPDPQGYTLALQALGISALEAVALEDSPSGVAAARAADVPVVVPLSAYFSHATFEGAVAIGPGLHQRSGWRPGIRAGSNTGSDANEPVHLDDIRSWCQQMDLVSQFG